MMNIRKLQVSSPGAPWLDCYNTLNVGKVDSWCGRTTHFGRTVEIGGQTAVFVKNTLGKLK